MAFGTHVGDVAVLNVTSGAVLWTATGSGPVYETPVIAADGAVVVAWGELGMSCCHISVMANQLQCLACRCTVFATARRAYTHVCKCVCMSMCLCVLVCAFPHIAY